MFRIDRRAAANFGAIVFVLIVYTFFGSIGRMSFHRVRWDQAFGKPAEGYYSSLAEGFLRGQLSMAHRPDQRLMALPNPYDFAARHDKIPYLWDASYLNGRYYLYFSPLPALLFYIPFRLATGSYPHDQLAGSLFGAWAFVMSALFVVRALRHGRLHVPLPVWTIALGLAGVVPFVITHCRTYEIAILCGAAMTATWSYALLRLLEAPLTRRLVWSSIWLALAIAARPNLGILIAVHAAAIWIAFRGRERARAAWMAMIPLGIAATALLVHNYARFLDPFEFGHRYQLTYMQMDERHVCGVRSVPEALRFLNNASLYAFAPPFLQSRFPFVDLAGARLDPRVSFSDVSDQIGGLAPLAPLAMLGSLIALVLALQKEKTSGLRGALLAAGAGWLALAGLCACWFVSARYEIDFWFLISAGAIVCIETALARLAHAGVVIRPLRLLLVAMALVSSIAGALLGFRGTVGAFPHFNPELYERLSRLFSVITPN